MQKILHRRSFMIKPKNNEVKEEIKKNNQVSDQILNNFIIENLISTSSTI